MHKRQNSGGAIKTISELLKLPSDVACGDTRIFMIGKRTVKIENYRSILVYSETLIKIQAKNQIVIIAGKELRIRYYDQDEMEINGWIKGVSFVPSKFLPDL